MNYSGASLIGRCTEFIILFASVTVIAFMITGGCGGGGGHGGQQTPGPTGPPPGCEPVVIDPECPSLSLTEWCDFWWYSCNLTTQNSEEIEPETIPVAFHPSDCISNDCFTLDCEASFGPLYSEMGIIMIDLSGIGTGTFIAPPEFSGTADLDGTAYDIHCPPQPIP